ncbi:MAG: hypothetical protein IKJ51_12205, partial [Clostridia bacterium]|nr:hypothetical protein [Clostridia bacterium]
ERILSPLLFCRFPRMQSIRLAVFHRPARGAAVPQPARKATIHISEGVSACGSGASNSQVCRLSFAKACLRGASAAPNSQSYHPYQRRWFCVARFSPETVCKMNVATHLHGFL